MQHLAIKSNLAKISRDNEMQAYIDEQYAGFVPSIKDIHLL